MLIAHRGMPGMYPEESLVAYRSSVAAGVEHIEFDCHLLADGAIGVMHDDTLDRTTTSTGPVSVQTSASWNRIKINSPSIIGGGWDLQPVPMLDDVLREFGNKVVIMPEAKSVGSGAAIVERLKFFGIRGINAVVQSSLAEELIPAIAVGYQTSLVVGMYAGTPTPPELVAAGYNWIAVGSSVSPSLIASLRNAGLKVAAYTVNTRKRLAEVSPYLDGVFSDEPLYLSGTKRLAADPFISQTWYHGHIAGNANGRGEFYAPNQWGYDLHLANSFASSLMGWANPMGGSETLAAVTIVCTVKFESSFSADRWASLAIATTDVAYAVDSPTNGINGYNFVFHKNGKISIYKVTNAGAPLLAALSTGITVIPDGGSASYRITVAGSELKLARTDIAYEVAVNDTDYRGAYLHAGVKGAFAKFSGIAVTTP